MGSPTIERESALEYAVDLRSLGGVRRRGKSEVGVAACFRKDLHFLVDPAVTSAGGIGQGPIPVDERITRETLSVPGRQAAVSGEGVPELDQRFARVSSCIGRGDPVMQMDLDFSPAGLAVFSQPLNKSLLVLLGRKEVGVSQRIAIGVP